MGKLIISGNPYAIDKIVVNDVEYPRQEQKFHIFYSAIECHAGDTVKIYHDPERQWVLHPEDEDCLLSDRARIWKNTRITGTILEPTECISFVVPENDESAILDIISNQGNDDTGFDNIYAAWSTGWAKQVVAELILSVKGENN